MGRSSIASKEERMLNIRRAAEQLLLEQNIHDFTMSDVAREAGVGEATLFRYVGAKMVLLFLVYGDRMDELLTAIEARDVKLELEVPPQRRTSIHYVDRILSVYMARCDFYIHSPENATIYLRSGFDVKNNYRWRNLAQGDRSIRLVGEILSDARSCGLLESQVSLAAVAQNCHAIYMHEIDRTPTRELDPSTIKERIRPRLEAQLWPLFGAD